MTEAFRIDPRRPFKLDPSGLRRIVLGEGLRKRPGDSAPKGLRQRADAKHWLMAVAHADRGSLDVHARQAVAAAGIMADAETGIVVVVLGDFNEDCAALGADLTIVLPEFETTRYQPERETEAVAQLICEYNAKHIFVPDRAGGDADLGRRLIARLGGPAATHAIELDRDHVAIAWSGHQSIAMAALPRLVLIEPGTVETGLPFIGSGEKVKRNFSSQTSGQQDACRDLGLESTDASAIAIEEADFVVSAGNGVQNVATLQALARALGAAVGASRVAVDSGRFAKDQQIGATGKTVSASTYIAIGISGAVQHLQGIKDCRHVIAINRDASAPIVKRADLTIIGDAEEIMKAMLACVESARASENEGAK